MVNIGVSRGGLVRFRNAALSVVFCIGRPVGFALRCRQTQQSALHNAELALADRLVQNQTVSTGLPFRILHTVIELFDPVQIFAHLADDLLALSHDLHTRKHRTAVGVHLQVRRIRCVADQAVLGRAVVVDDDLLLDDVALVLLDHQLLLQTILAVELGGSCGEQNDERRTDQEEPDDQPVVGGLLLKIDELDRFAIAILGDTHVDAEALLGHIVDTQRVGGRRPFAGQLVERERRIDTVQDVVGSPLAVLQCDQLAVGEVVAFVRLIEAQGGGLLGLVGAVQLHLVAGHSGELFLLVLEDRKDERLVVHVKKERVMNQSERVANGTRVVTLVLQVHRVDDEL